MRGTTPKQPDEPKTTHVAAASSRGLVRGIVSSFASRGIAALVPLTMIPIMLPALGTATYGAWMAIVSITSMLIWADLGLGNGLLTRLSRHLADDDHGSARRDILATYSIVSFVGCLLGILTLVSPLFVSWPELLNAPESSAGSVTSIAILCLLLFCINMPLSLIQRVQYAAQQVAISNLFTAAGPVVSLALTFGSTRSDLSATLVVGSATIGPLIANLAATVWFFIHNRTLIPSFADRKGAELLTLLSLGGLFVLISTVSSIAINSDSMIIARTLDAVRVADYAVAARVMAAMGLLINLVNLPLWPAAGNALARGDVAWVIRIARRMMILSVVFVGLSSMVVLAVSEPLMGVLSQGLVERDLALLICLGAWYTVVALTSPMMMVQNAAGVLVPQLVGWTLFLCVSLPLKVLGISKLGLYAAPLVGALAYCALVLPFALWGFRRSMNLAKTKHGSQGAASADESVGDGVSNTDS